MARIRVAFVGHSPSKYRYSPELPPFEERRLATIEQHKLTQWQAFLLQPYTDVYTYWYNVLDRPSTTLDPNPWELDLIRYALGGMHVTFALGSEVYLFLKPYVPEHELIRLPNPRQFTNEALSPKETLMLSKAKVELIHAFSKIHKPEYLQP